MELYNQTTNCEIIYALILSCDKSGSFIEFYLSYTKDSGATWSSKLIERPSALRPKEKTDNQTNLQDEDQKKDYFSSGMGWIDFYDLNHGWIVLEIPTNLRLGMNSGILLQTTDSGNTWKQIGNYLPIAGPFRFISTKDGWMTGRLDNTLHSTQDGGYTWQQKTLEPPPTASENGWYDLPIFKDSQNGFLSMTSVSSILILFNTHNSGKTWNVDRMLSDIKRIANVYPSVLIDSTLITISASDIEATLTLIKVLPDGKIITTKTNALNIKGNLTPRSLRFSGEWHLSFITINQGWVSTNTGQLLATDDGGKTWTVITPQ